MFKNFLTNFTLFRQIPYQWIFWWLLVPNLAIIAMWTVGGPSMAPPILINGILAIMVSFSRSVALRVIGIIASFLILIVTYITSAFNLAYTNPVASLQFLQMMNPMVAPEYLIAGVLLAGLFVLTLRRAPKLPPLASRNQVLQAFAAVALLVNFDMVATAGTRGSYHGSAPEGAAVDSAIIQNRITPQSVKAPNLVVILVEALGVPNNPEDQALFDRAWNPARWASRYAVSQGKSLYYGSTTSAEMRELCGVWADQTSFNFDTSHCLPEQFQEAGFHTVGMHSFYGGYFEREKWYPKLGFKQQLFSHDLHKRGAKACGGVFPGVCDRDVPRQIGDILRSSKEKRNFVYWLTLNTHQPVIETDPMQTKVCTIGSPQWRKDFPVLCRSYMLHQQLADALTAEIMRKDFPEADILIVGDHMPPFVPRTMRTRFDSEHVPWILLRNRAAQQRAKVAVN